MEESDFLDYLAKGGRLTSPANVPPGYRRELLRLMAGFVDSQLAGAAGFAATINRAPSLAGRRLLARLVLEKLGHGETVLDLMAPFGTDPLLYVGLHDWSSRVERARDLGRQRLPGDMRLNVFHYPLTGWEDALVMNLVMGQASAIQVEELAACSYQPLAEACAEIATTEAEHTRDGANCLAGLIACRHDLEPLRQSLSYWRSRVAASFGGADSPRLEPMRRFGLRRNANEALRARWEAALDESLRHIGLT
ncbi:MAG: phenylacetate-CoA oxygenase subunit PaaI [Rhodospirillales bacterium]